MSGKPNAMKSREHPAIVRGAIHQRDRERAQLETLLRRRSLCRTTTDSPADEGATCSYFVETDAPSLLRRGEGLRASAVAQRAGSRTAAQVRRPSSCAMKNSSVGRHGSRLSIFFWFFMPGPSVGSSSVWFHPADSF